mmetsp:Transcript_7498/g.9311  ORF Transcript_7498/g.9311 Transcript_7498/m.9311 type:complete len:326 (+) Transcript_7498:112-1089(+)
MSSIIASMLKFMFMTAVRMIFLMPKATSFRAHFSDHLRPSWTTSVFNFAKSLFRSWSDSQGLISRVQRDRCFASFFASLSRAACFFSSSFSFIDFSFGFSSDSSSSSPNISSMSSSSSVAFFPGGVDDFSVSWTTGFEAAATTTRGALSGGHELRMTGTNRPAVQSQLLTAGNVLTAAPGRPSTSPTSSASAADGWSPPTKVLPSSKSARHLSPSFDARFTPGRHPAVTGPAAPEKRSTAPKVDGLFSGKPRATGVGAAAALGAAVLTGFIVGKSRTSRMESLSVRNIVRRSMPMPQPPVGGRAYSIAVQKSSSLTIASSSPSLP